MKKLFLLLLIISTFYACNKDDDNDETLPEATQTGAGIFACKVNGQSFIDTSGGYFNCFYQYVDDEYYFGISAIDNDFKETNLNWSIGLLTEAKTITEGETLNLISNQPGNAWAGGSFITNTVGGEASYTNSQYTGELTITKLDFTNHIVSGTFWFDLKHPTTNNKIEIRDGRFDTIFGQ